MIIPKNNTLLTLVGLAAAVLMTGCSGGDASIGHGAGATDAASTTDGGATNHVAASDDGIAGVLQWSGDSSGRQVYKTADCAVFPGTEGPPIMEAPRSVENPPDMLAKLDQPWLKIAFPEKKAIFVKFLPQPRHQTHKNSFLGSEKSAGSVSWSKKGDLSRFVWKIFKLLPPQGAAKGSLVDV